MQRNQKKCPSCAEAIKLEASRCKHCGHEFTDLQVYMAVGRAGATEQEQNVDRWLTRVRVGDELASAYEKAGHPDIALYRSKKNGLISTWVFSQDEVKEVAVGSGASIALVKQRIAQHGGSFISNAKKQQEQLINNQQREAEERVAKRQSSTMSLINLLIIGGLSLGGTFACAAIVGGDRPNDRTRIQEATDRVCEIAGGCR